MYMYVCILVLCYLELAGGYAYLCTCGMYLVSLWLLCACVYVCSMHVPTILMGL